MTTAGYETTETSAEGETSLAAQAVAKAEDPKEQAEAQWQEQTFLENAPEKHPRADTQEDGLQELLVAPADNSRGASQPAVASGGAAQPALQELVD